MQARKLLLVLAAAVLVPGRLFCEEWIIPRTTYYISAAQRDMPDFPAPPAAGSKTDKEDLAALKEWQLKRTPEQCARAAAAGHAGFEEFFGDLGVFPRPLPASAAEVFGRVKADTDGAAADVKERFRRPRPFLRDAALEPCLGRIGGLAYPSGHAAISRLFALMLADLLPSRKAEFLARADEAALDRVIAGVHYPSDIAAGRGLADRLYRVYRKSPAFKADMRALKNLLRDGALKR